MRQRRVLGAAAAFGIFALLIVLAVFSMRMTSRPPHIDSIEPHAAHPEETLVIRGEHFGNERGRGGVEIAGIELTFSHFLSWSSSEIRVKVPHGVESGRVFVHTDNGRSNGVLFSNKEHIPVVLSGPAEPGQPYIENISPQEGSVGTEVTLSGVNFGRRRGEGKVYFRFLLSNLTGSSKREDQEAFEHVAARQLDYDYKSWGDNEIVVYVPDGAVSGSVHVRTDRGKSNAVYFEVLTPAGSKSFAKHRGYQIQQRVRVLDLPRAGEEASLELWVPKIYNGYAQRGVEESHEPEPMWSDYQGVMRYHMTGAGDSSLTTTHTYWFDRYSINTEINPRQVGRYNTERELYRNYTAANAFIPADKEEYQAIARRAGRRANTPYWKARTVYDYLLEQLEFDPQAIKQELSSYLEEGSAGSHGYALLYVTLLRCEGVPARPVSGYIVTGEREAQPHLWAEFYLPEYGWIPVDPALGEGSVALSPTVTNAREYYFGNLDNQHITFTRRVVDIPQISPQSRRSDAPVRFALQTIYEEYHPDLEGYRSSWGEIEVVGWW
jgi:transglutaminase-like putative cysteine protease